MIWIMAWRNIWRHPTRSGVVIMAVALGIWAALSLTGFATGMMRSYVNSAIDNGIGHLQVHAPGFTEDYGVQYTLPSEAVLSEALETLPGLEAYSLRTVVSGMAASSRGARGVMVKGIAPEQERAVSGIAGQLTEGEFLPEMRGNAIVIGQGLAEKLSLKLGAKLVLTFQGTDREITAAAFRVAGIFKTGSTPFDEGMAFVLRSDLNRLLRQAGPDSSSSSSSELAHELVLRLADASQVDTVASSLRAALPGQEVKTYREVSPDLELYESQIQNVSLIYLTVIMLALVFGIINTMLMAVLERIKELGMLMAIGMNKLRVFSMILLEAMLLGLISTPIGLLLGWLTIGYVREHGIDLSAYSEGMASYGLSQVVYFDIEPVAYFQMAAGVFLTSVLAAIYPALKAVRLRPVEALQRI